jgi:putative membrane protein
MQMKALWILTFGSVFIWSGVAPKDYYTWALEVAPAVIGLVLLALTYKRFPLTPMVYLLILLHSIVLMIGGHYTYAEVPLFDMIRDSFGMQRNNYDKLGHFMQGFVPAMIARELIIRKNIIIQGAWVNFFVVSVCLAISALYELIEWMVALLSGQAAEAFLGTQGYVWDTQSDMGLALIGAICALILLSKWHDKQLLRLQY